MIFKFKKHNSDLYNTLLILSRNLFFYSQIKLKDCFETRIYLMFIHFSIMMIVSKYKRKKFDQKEYDYLFFNIENNLRELGFGDVSVNKKMKELNKIFYDILLKINIEKSNFKTNKKLILKYFNDENMKKSENYELFSEYFLNFFKYCFELPVDIVIEEAINFKN